MRAVEFSSYGSPEVLKIVNKDIPIPKQGDVLVKVCATAVNDWDWCLVRGSPFLYRLMFGLLTPKIKTPGAEIAGIIEDIAADVTNFQKGDYVYGDISSVGLGGFSEYICVPSAALSPMPKNLNFSQAVALPHASLLAWQSMVSMASMTEGEKILINGAGGGVGTLGLQIAKRYNCHVTGVDKNFKLEALKRLGFDRVIDFNQTDFTKTGDRYDLILDTKTTCTPWCYLDALNTNGRYITVGGDLSKLLLLILLKGLFRKRTGKILEVLGLKVNQGLDEITRLCEAGELVPLLDKTYPLEKASHAIERFGKAEHIGKIIISMENRK